MTDEVRLELRQMFERMVRGTMAEGPADEVRYIPPLATEQQLGLSALLQDPALLPQALADYLLDLGHEYATACYERGKREERERIAERLYSESAHVLSRRPDEDGRLEFAAAVLSSVADDLVFGVPPTAPKTTD